MPAVVGPAFAPALTPHHPRQEGHQVCWLLLLPWGRSAAWALRSPSLNAGASLWSFQPPSISQGAGHLSSALSDSPNYWVFYCPLNVRLWGMECAAGPFLESLSAETASGKQQLNPGTWKNMA